MSNRIRGNTYNENILKYKYLIQNNEWVTFESKGALGSYYHYQMILAKQKLRNASLEWAEALNYNRNHVEWSNDRIERTQWQDYSGGFNDTVPLDELVLYLAVKYLECDTGKFIIEPLHPISQEFSDLLIKKLGELLVGKGYYAAKEKPDSFRVMGLESTFTDAIKPVDDLNNNSFPNISNDEQRKYVERGIRHYLEVYADNFPFYTNYEVKTYNEAKKIYKLITNWKLYLAENGITKKSLIQKSTNVTRGYEALTITSLKGNIKEKLNAELSYRSLSEYRKGRIISRMVEIILN